MAHLSDLHFGTEQPDLVDELLAELRRRSPDGIVISGDLTQRARRREFAAARDFIDALPTHALVVPGNHDLPSHNLGERFLRPLARFRAMIEHDPFPSWVTDDAAVLGLDTTRPAGWYLNWSRGRISRWQLDAAAEFFRGPGNCPTRIIVTHHPFMHPPGGSRRALVGGARVALDVFDRCGVHFLLAGHFHKAYTGTVSMRHPDDPGIVVAQASTAVSRRLRAEPNAFNWIEITGGEVEITSLTWNGFAFRSGSPARYAFRPPKP